MCCLTWRWELGEGCVGLSVFLSELPSCGSCTDICDVQRTELPQHAELPGLIQDGARSTGGAARQCAIWQSAAHVVCLRTLGQRPLYAPVTFALGEVQLALCCVNIRRVWPPQLQRLQAQSCSSALEVSPPVDAAVPRRAEQGSVAALERPAAQLGPQIGATPCRASRGGLTCWRGWAHVFARACTSGGTAGACRTGANV